MFTQFFWRGTWQTDINWTTATQKPVCSLNEWPLILRADPLVWENIPAALLRCGNTTVTAVEATSERSFMSAVNERECARSSEWQRLNGPNLAAEVHQGYMQLHSVRLHSQHVCVNNRDVFLVILNVNHHNVQLFLYHFCCSLSQCARSSKRKWKEVN